MLSVQRSFAALLCGISLSFFTLLSSSPEGRWNCMTKAGQWDDHTWYQVNCSGDIEFKKDGVVESACTDAFSPTGSLWKTEGDQLILSDSEGNPFVRYTWQMPDERTLILVKNGITFTFEKVVKPRPAGN